MSDVFSHSSPLQNWQSIGIISIHSMDTLPPELFWMWEESQSSVSISMTIKKSMRAGHQNWCSKIANYLLDVFILIYSYMNRKCFKNFPLHPQSWSYEQKITSFSLIPVSFHSIGFQSAAITTVMCSLKPVSCWNTSTDFCFSPSWATQVINRRCIWHNYTFLFILVKAKISHFTEALIFGCNAFFVSLKKAKISCFNV